MLSTSNRSRDLRPERRKTSETHGTAEARAGYLDDLAKSLRVHEVDMSAVTRAMRLLPAEVSGTVPPYPSGSDAVM